MEKSVRVRFAPSPTGPLHIGGVRTALFNYLFAKKHNGTFVLRIEDTDQNRYTPGAEKYIIDALNWCAIPFDEGPGKDGDYGPYRQSERKNIYKKHIDVLLKNGKAYYAFDSTEDLALERKKHEEKGKTFIYNWHNRTKGRLINSLILSKEETKKKIESGAPYVVRFLMPEGQTVELNDMVRGKMSIDSNILDDKILFKSDGMPTYHLANIVDDHLMEISHVIRGEEWLPSLALHQMLYEAFGWDAPQFAHLPLILKPTGKGKLSKRDGDKLGFPVFPLEWKDENTTAQGYKESGYLSDAVVNFLAFLGWNPGTEQEFFSLGELVQSFNINQVNKSGARFDPEKIKWYNHHYIQQTTNEELAEKLINEKSELAALDRGYVELVVGLIKERAELVPELWALGKYFFEAPKGYDEKSLKKALKDDTKDLLRELIVVLKNTNDESATTLKASVSEWIKSNGVGFGKVMMPLRVALVGSLQGVDVFDIVFCIGKEETIRRINALIQHH
ncbi:MAG: glutamate--tRNA ligase [Flavobacteriaceae bacterium]